MPSAKNISKHWCRKLLGYIGLFLYHFPLHFDQIWSSRKAGLLESFPHSTRNMRKYMAPPLENQRKTIKIQGPTPSKLSQHSEIPRPQPLKINWKSLKPRAPAPGNQAKIFKIQAHLLENQAKIFKIQGQALENQTQIFKIQCPSPWKSTQNP